MLDVSLGAKIILQKDNTSNYIRKFCELFLSFCFS